jgi:murein DD-endopeptidase MepM/ murein hydrolase activator NlpD
VRSSCPDDIPANQLQSFEGDTKNDAGDKAAKGRYKFVVTEPDGSEVDASGVPADDDARFQYRGYIFPLHGTPHTYGDGWGAGRGHRGQDLFENGFPSPCGAPVLAARAGTVSYKRKNAGAAGNYIVVDGSNTSRSTAYLHLQRKTFSDFVGRGDHVRTGQQIAAMGKSGNATACHLHFELWRGLWDQVDPESSLRKWDEWS